MSGGSLSYICYTIENNLVGEMGDEIMNEFVKNFAELTHVLHDKFGFGDKRLTKYKDHMIYQLECIADDYVDWSDFTGNIKMVEK